jgi:hypothetical protein
LVEFGIVALLFVLILFGIVDFGLLLNGWLGVSAAARQGSRQAAVGLSTRNSPYDVFQNVRSATHIAGLSSNDLSFRLEYCASGSSSCPSNVICSNPPNGDYSGCTPPSEPSQSYVPSNWQTGGQVTMTVTAPVQVVTPLVRPFFGCSGNAPNCPVNLTSTVTMRYEGV